MYLYHHKVQYYETDRMQITHHSNYVRWMEEARMNVLEQIGWSYSTLEKKQIISPVVSVSCQFLHTTTFDDEIVITTTVSLLTAGKLELAYTMKCDEQIVCTATSRHCFLDKDNNLINLKRQLPEFYVALNALKQ